MSGDLDRVRASVSRRDEQMAEFVSLPEEVREAALEYALALMQGSQEAEDEDVRFILVGRQESGRAVLFASTDVAETKFGRRVDGIDEVPIVPGGRPVARIPRMSIFAAARMRSFEQYVGADYAAALQTLQEEWARRRRARQQARELGS